MASRAHAKRKMLNDTDRRALARGFDGVFAEEFAARLDEFSPADRIDLAIVTLAAFVTLCWGKGAETVLERMVRAKTELADPIVMMEDLDSILGPAEELLHDSEGVASTRDIGAAAFDLADRLESVARPLDRVLAPHQSRGFVGLLYLEALGPLWEGLVGYRALTVFDERYEFAVAEDLRRLTAAFPEEDRQYYADVIVRRKREIIREIALGAGRQPRKS